MYWLILSWMMKMWVIIFSNYWFDWNDRLIKRSDRLNRIDRSKLVWSIGLNWRNNQSIKIDYSIESIWTIDLIDLELWLNRSIGRDLIESIKIKIDLLIDRLICFDRSIDWLIEFDFRISSLSSRPPCIPSPVANYTAPLLQKLSRFEFF